MVTKRFSRTDSTENQSCLQLYVSSYFQAFLLSYNNVSATQKKTQSCVSCWKWQACLFMRLSSVLGRCTLTPSFPWPVSLSMRYVCFWQKQHYGFRCSISWLMTLVTDTDSCHTYFSSLWLRIGSYLTSSIPWRYPSSRRDYISLLLW